MKLIIQSLFFNFIFVTGFSQPQQIYIHQDKLDFLAKNHKIDKWKFKQLCYEYLFLIEQNVLFKNTIHKLEKLPFYAKKAYESGEISMYSKLNLELKYQEILNEIASTSYNITIKENEIKSTLNTFAAIIPETDTLKKYTSFSLLEFIEIQEKSKPDSNIASFMLKENKLIEYYKVKDDLDFYLQYKMQVISFFERQTEYKYKEEEIGLLDYYNHLIEIMKLKKEYLITLNNYNQAVIKIDKFYEKNYNL